MTLSGLPDTFTATSVFGISGQFYLRRDLAESVACTLRADPTQYPSPTHSTGRGTVQEFDSNAGVIVVRRYRHGGLFGRLLGEHHLGPGRAVHEVAITERAQAAGIPVARVVGIRIDKTWGPCCRLDLLTLKVSDASDLQTCLESIRDVPARHRLLKQLAALLRLVHATGLFHADLHIRNLLVRERPPEGFEFVLLDLDRARWQPSGSDALAKENLYRLNRSVEKFSGMSTLVNAHERLSFLREYLLTDRTQRRTLREWARQCTAHLNRHRLWWRLCRATAGGSV